MYQGEIGLYIDVMEDAKASQARRDAYLHLTKRAGTNLSFDSEIPRSSNDALVERFREGTYR